MASARVLLPALLICLALQLLLLFSSRALGPGEVQPVYPADLVLHAVTLLLTGVCIGRFLIGNPEQRPSSPPFTVTTHAAAASEKSPVISSSKASPYGSMDLLHRVLTQLLENPDSTEPFQLLLTHILEICGTEAGAIFVSSDSDGQLIRLATSCDDYVERFRELLRHHDIRPPMEIDPPPLVLNLPTRPDSHYLVQWLTQGQHGYGVLLLEVNSARNALSKEILASLHSYADYLGGILYSTRRARLKLRNAQCEERAAIARDLHDSLAQSLSYLKIQASLLQSALARNSDHENIAELSNTIVEMRNTLNVAYRHLRELITTFRLTMHGKTFAQALEESIDEFERRSAIAFDLDNRLPAGLLGAGEEMQVLHIVREAIGNVVRHSHATYCGVTVRPTDDSGVQLTVDDNGLGIQSASDAEKHHGTIIMQERAHHLGGTLRVENREHGGTRVCLNIPTRRRAPANPLQSSLAQ
jgi:two-component system nitrate/nitrite sensor histidine kinase NarX